MNIAIIPNLTRESALETTRQICAQLGQLGACSMLDEAIQPQFSGTPAQFLPLPQMLTSCDLVIAVGGDGSIIYAAHKAIGAGKPVLGINAGRLAFLAGLEQHELPLLERLLTGGYVTEQRMLLQAQIVQDGVNVGARAVYFVYENKPREPSFVKGSDYVFGVSAHPFDRRHNDYGVVESRKRALDLARKVNVTGRVDNVHGHALPFGGRCRRAHRYASLTFYRQIVCRGGTLVDASRRAQYPRAVEYLLGEGRFARVDVGEYSYVVIYFRHKLSFF